MPGPLQHSPADIVRQLLIDSGWARDFVDEDTSWAVFEGAEPDLPDDCVTVYDTTGIDHGREGVAGERAESHGFQVRVRSKVKTDGFSKVREIAVGFDESVYLVVVHVDDVAYQVQSVKRVGEPAFIGYDAPRSKRSVFTLNSYISLRQVNEIVGSFILLEILGARLLQEMGAYLLLE